MEGLGTKTKLKPGSSDVGEKRGRNLFLHRHYSFSLSFSPSPPFLTSPIYIVLSSSGRENRKEKEQEGEKIKIAQRGRLDENRYFSFVVKKCHSTCKNHNIILKFLHYYGSLILKF
jgi:hypothetical protein